MIIYRAGSFPPRPPMPPWQPGPPERPGSYVAGVAYWPA